MDKLSILANHYAMFGYGRVEGNERKEKFMSWLSSSSKFEHTVKKNIGQKGRKLYNLAFVLSFQKVKMIHFQA